MITESVRQRLYQDLEETQTLQGAGRGSVKMPGGAEASGGSELSTRWQQVFTRLKDEILGELLFHLHSLFDFKAEDAKVQVAVRKSVESFYGAEEVCATRESIDARDCLLSLFLQSWHGSARFESDAPLTGLHHLNAARFFRKTPQEIASWTRIFLLIERYHRLDAREGESRIDRYHHLHAQVGRVGEPVIKSMEDLILWLEYRLVRESSKLPKDVGLLSHELAGELEGIIAPGLINGHPVQPAVYLFLRCHQFCLAETLDVPEERRLEQLLAMRQLESLLDLMRVVVYRTVMENPLPEVGSFLDQLQQEGFNIEHGGFRDPYEAHLIPLEETEQLEATRLSIFLPFESASGEYDLDLPFSGRMMTEWHGHTVDEIMKDCEAYALALIQPLPKAHFIHRLLRFSANWLTARTHLPVFERNKNFEEEIRNFLPEGTLRHLVRPRKGYEIQLRQELNQLIKGVSERHLESIERIASRRRVQGFHDYAEFTRHLVFRHLRDLSTGNSQEAVERAQTFVRKLVTPEWVVMSGKSMGVDLHQIHPHTLESVPAYLMDVVSRENLTSELEKSFQISANEVNFFYDGVINEVTPSFYRLLVAQARREAKLPRLEASVTQIPEMVRLLVPPLRKLREKTHGMLREEFNSLGVTLYRSQLPFYLLSVSEWEAFMAWEVRNFVGTDLSRFLDSGDIEAVLRSVEAAAQHVALPPDTLLFESVRSALLKVLGQNGGSVTFSESSIQEVTNLLPQLDCAACGQPACRAFARSLLAGDAEPRQCVQLPSLRLSDFVRKLQQLRASGGGPAPEINALEVLNHRHLFRGSPEGEAVRNVLSVTEQKARRLFVERAKGLWESLSPKPQIFKHPDAETIYGELCRYLGRMAAERLADDEKDFLVEHGEERQKAEWQMFKQRQDWLSLMKKSRQSRPLLQTQDPVWIAKDAYRNRLFLQQLSPHDRRLMLRRRMERYQDGFSHWWNEDLLTMNLPDFSIGDWEDFSKIIRNAYWHQESSLPATDALCTLEKELLLQTTAQDAIRSLLDHWLEDELEKAAGRRLRIQRFIDPDDETVIRTVDDLRVLIRFLVDESEAQAQEIFEGGHSEPVTGSFSEDLLAVKVRRLWERFQDGGFDVDPSFSCHWDDLLPAEENALKKELAPGNGAGTSVETGLPAHEQRSGTPSFFITGWDAPLHERKALIVAMLSACVMGRYQETAEVEWVKKILFAEPSNHSKDKAASSSVLDNRSHHPVLISVRSLRLLIKELLGTAKDAKAVASELHGILSRRPDAQKELLEDALLQVILKRQLELFYESNGGGKTSREGTTYKDLLFTLFPNLRTSLDALLIHHQAMDRDRLLHYLYLLSKMEGDLDVLTALLREIRETSDIIEAAWLRFTQERIMEGPSPKTLPGTSLGIPLLASRIKDKAPINLALKEGISRREKRNVATAVTELLNIIRYHLLLRMEGSPSEDGVSLILGDIQEAGYDIDGLEDEALERAIQKEWARREVLPEKKIWIYATVIARRLAGNHSAFQEADREFYKIRMDLLKDDETGAQRYNEISHRRGVALGQIKDEMYRQLSDLLEPERIGTFQKRIGQIVGELDQKRGRVYGAWLKGEVNRETFFYLLRLHQKGHQEPTTQDFERFLRDHWFKPLGELRSSQRLDKGERIHDLDERFRALFGTSFLELETEVRALARDDLANWKDREMAALNLLIENGDRRSGEA